MRLTKLFQPKGKKMRIAGLMSGSGSNLRNIIELERAFGKKAHCPFEIAVIFSDNPNSNAQQIGEKYGIPVVGRDIRDFYAKAEKPFTDMQTREEFDKRTVEALSEYGVSVAAYAGYMSIASQILVNAFLGVNVHPADLSIMENGQRKYRGGHAVRDAILAGEKELRATTHIVSEIVDEGDILMVSAPCPVQLGDDWNPNDKDLVKKVAAENQNRLKQVGDWVIFPKTLLYLAQGRYERNASGNLYFDGNQISNGVRLK